MELRLVRFSSGEESTLGLLFVDGEFFCYTLEDQFNEPKVFGETRIPPGRYQIKFRNEGGMIVRYKKRFPWHRGMLWLQDVPDFEWVYLHVGNNDDHTDGCPVIGDGQVQNVTGRGSVTSSVSAYKRFYEVVASALEAGEEVWITVTGMI